MTTNELLNKIEKEIDELSNKDTSNIDMDALIAIREEEEWLRNMKADIMSFIKEYVEEKEDIKDDI